MSFRCSFARQRQQALLASWTLSIACFAVSGSASPDLMAPGLLQLLSGLFQARGSSTFDAISSNRCRYVPDCS